MPTPVLPALCPLALLHPCTLAHNELGQYDERHPPDDDLRNTSHNRMILRFFLFEVRYWLRQPMAYIFIALIAFLTGAAIVSDNVQIGMAVGNVLKNAPYLLYLWYATWSALGLLLVTAFVNATAIRDRGRGCRRCVPRSSTPACPCFRR